MGEANSGRRKRAVGTRDHVLSHLARVGDVSDAGGKASTVLAAAIGYPGSSIAFAQLLTGMERAGLIEREIRGKRTYRIAAAGAAGRGAGPAARPARRRGRTAPASVVPPPVSPPASTGQASTGQASTGQAAGQAGLDYDELARRLLAQVMRQLANPPGPAPSGVAPAVPAQAAADQDAVASLEQKLATAASRQRKLTAENARLREQLREAQRDLAEAQERASAEPAGERFGRAEVALLERLLAPLRDQGGREEAGA